VDTTPHVAVVVLTMADDDAAVFDALRAGARGYLVKGASRAELVRAIRGAAAGEAIFGPAIARRLMTFFATSPTHAPTAFPELTDREREVLALIARGLSNQQIVDRLVVSPKTIRNHVSNIFSKLQVRDRAEAIVRAREAGLGVDRERS
jgi:DNA-binding NarL/FixJ family response regulator